ncbi:MAG: OmpA family protein [Phycisphaerales bacterium]|nr:OmpA family protein [Phycisphaerales bacterium]
MKRIALCLMLAVTSFGAVGCKSNEPSKEQLAKENQDLRNQIADLNTRMAQTPPPVAVATPQPQPQPTYTPPPSRSESFGSSQQEVTIEVGGDVLFASGQTTVKPEARKTLDGIARQLNGQYGGRQIRVVGHTDSDPIRKSKWGSNEALSLARANAVVEYLASKGVSRSRMTADGRGAQQPKATKAASRRVEIVVLGSN